MNGGTGVTGGDTGEDGAGDGAAMPASGKSDRYAMYAEPFMITTMSCIYIYIY